MQLYIKHIDGPTDIYQLNYDVTAPIDPGYTDLQVRVANGQSPGTAISAALEAGKSNLGEHVAMEVRSASIDAATCTVPAGRKMLGISIIARTTRLDGPPDDSSSWIPLSLGPNTSWAEIQRAFRTGALWPHQLEAYTPEAWLSGIPLVREHTDVGDVESLVVTLLETLKALAAAGVAVTEANYFRHGQCTRRYSVALTNEQRAPELAWRVANASHGVCFDSDNELTFPGSNAPEK